jgi:hypothetical protein
VTNYKKDFDVGYLLLIHPPTIILLARPIMTVLRCGSFKEIPSKNGKRLVHYCGYMGTVSISQNCES